MSETKHPFGCPVPGCEGEIKPSLSTSENRYGVALVGEAPGEQEAKIGYPFVGKAGFKLTRLIEWAGLDRSLFDIWNTVWCRPPDNKLEGTTYEYGAIEYWRPTWTPLLDRVSVVVPMGNVALHAFTGEKGILRRRGYIVDGKGWYRVVPTVHPSFIQRGQSKYSAAFIHDIQKAVELARDGYHYIQPDFLLDPSPADANNWAETYLERLRSVSSGDMDILQRAAQHSLGVGYPFLAYDIETPGKGDDEGELDEDGSNFIWRIGFSYEPNRALSIPWTGPYIGTIRKLLESSGEKIVWNAEFDNPRIRRAGVNINGIVHDGMVAWHILHSDLPKGLGFVATFTCPFQPPWKHLSSQQPAFYNATDAVVEYMSFISIRKELITTGLWDVYQKDVLDLEPILLYMSRQGMPIDPVVREDRANRLQSRLVEVKAGMEAAVPLDARRVDQVYVNTPKDTTGLLNRPGVRTLPVCSACGLKRPRKEHFKRTVKKINPCADAEKVFRDESVTEWYRLSDFTPSRDQLIRYHQFHGRPLPTKWDKKEGKRKVSFDEKALKKLVAKYPKDVLYSLILQHRELDKIAGTYIGRPVG